MKLTPCSMPLSTIETTEAGSMAEKAIPEYLSVTRVSNKDCWEAISPDWGGAIKTTGTPSSLAARCSPIAAAVQKGESTLTTNANRYCEGSNSAVASRNTSAI